MTPIASPAAERLYRALGVPAPRSGVMAADFWENDGAVIVGAVGDNCKVRLEQNVAGNKIVMTRDDFMALSETVTTVSGQIVSQTKQNWSGSDGAKGKLQPVRVSDPDALIGEVRERATAALTIAQQVVAETKLPPRKPGPSAVTKP